MIHWPTWRLAAALVLAAIIGGTICHLFHLIREELEIRQIARRVREDLMKELPIDEHITSCEGCKWNLGDDCCSLNAYEECVHPSGIKTLWRDGDEDA